ncbi:MAG: PepSY-like domain-containing protein [Bacteroidetes bacterium]|nr:PepSY-like domain-containing protein [Bacteroidota bacterium]
MHLLAISLLTILAGTLLLAKFKKEIQGKFFVYISWFFIAVGFILFLICIAGGICKLKHHCFNRHHGFRYEMMERGHGEGPGGMMGRGPGCGPGMMMGRSPGCCPPEMMEKSHGCQMQGGSCCAGHMPGEPGSPVQATDAVKQAFVKMFPAATDVKYEMEKDAFEATFKDKGVEMSANFDAAGKWLETETEIKSADLPKEVTASAAKNFAGFKISEVAKVETPDKGVCYEMDVNNGKEGYEVQISPKGDILNKHPLKKEKEEEKKDKD